MAKELLVASKGGTVGAIVTMILQLLQNVHSYMPCLRPVKMSEGGPDGFSDLSELSSKVILSAASVVSAATMTAATSARDTDPGFMLSP